ncbi:xanthine dehydrogenase accessory protein XdhC [Pseudorhodobacter sp. W20_MBD10_FR17]|uniref:xanthine dehydrogenase accessory protein XdhC n=1 Tax=Pseudorhodobacter sp. W20_MBD10_FR17 TaxID=3240266 RepID=UPI003F9C5B32
MFDRDAVRAAVVAHGRVARVVIAAIAGSSPREVGAAMLVWPQGQSGTIGGGALEYQAAQTAREMLENGTAQRLTREALGPKLGQCCGGTVTLLTEVFEASTLPTADIFARPVDSSTMPLAVSRLLAQARGQGQRPVPALIQGWMVEPIAHPSRQIWVWGAGHVGRALVGVLAPLPDLAITWIDVAADRFPPDIPAGVTMLPAAAPEALMPHAPVDTEHLILTYSHRLDLALCHAALNHGFTRCGLIGSKTKWVRFQRRLAALGHAPHTIARIDCPIGDTGLGKHPQAIAIGVASQLIRPRMGASRQENAV